jgi:hypothetical protein
VTQAFVSETAGLVDGSYVERGLMQSCREYIVTAVLTFYCVQCLVVAYLTSRRRDREIRLEENREEESASSCTYIWGIEKVLCRVISTVDMRVLPLYLLISDLSLESF